MVAFSPRRKKGAGHEIISPAAELRMRKCEHNPFAALQQDQLQRRL
jgi:hypothetical protein